MAQLQFTPVREDLFARGIDARSSEDQIGPGFLRDALNVDIVKKYVRTRKGYQGFAGNVPVRVLATEYVNGTDQLCFTLDSSIDLLSVRSSPIIAYGRSSPGATGTGPFTTTDSAHYYTEFTQNSKRVFLQGTHTLTIPGTEHGLGSDDLFVQVSENTNPNEISNVHVFPDEITIDESSFDISIDYTNGGNINKSMFIFYSDKSTSIGDSYVSGLTNIGSGATGTIVINAATHQLSTFNIIARCYRDDGGTRSEVIPDSLVIDSAGEVTVTITNSSGSAADFFVILASVPDAQTSMGGIGVGGYRITINSPESPFVFLNAYRINGTSYEMIIPQSVAYSETTDTLDIVINNPGSDSFIAYWQYGTVMSNQLCVLDTSISVSGNDPAPQITIWGLDHTEIYGQNRTSREGWTNHIDSYRIPGENRIITGLGGNLFSAREYSENGVSHKYGSLFPNLAARAGADTVLAPAFWGTGDTPARTRGYITGTNVADNWATVTSVEYDSAVGGGTVKYTLTIPDLALLTSAGGVESDINNIISSVTDLEDYLSVEDMSYSRHNGTFRIRQVTNPTATTIAIWVDNSRVTTSDWDDSGTAGLAGIFTDQIQLSSDSPFLVGDRITSVSIDDSHQLTSISNRVSSATDIAVFDGIDSVITLSNGTSLLGVRTSSVIPLRDSALTPVAHNFVRGDMVSITGYDRLFRVTGVFPFSPTSITSITGDGTTATATISPTTATLQVGMSVTIQLAGGYSGTHEILDLPTTDTFTFSSTETDTINTGILIAQFISINEEIEWSESNDTVVRVERRFLPIEAPDDSYTLTPSTREFHFTSNIYSNQPFLRSCMSSDTMFFQNGDDPAMKFDGVNVYRAGLPNWQPGCFIQQDTNAAAEIVTSLRSVTTTGIDATLGQLEVATEGELEVLPIGTEVRLTGSTERYTIRSTKVQDPTGTPAYYIYVDRALDSNVTAGTASEVAIYKYYYRLNAVDINNNIVASAVSQSEDYTIELTSNAAIYHKLIGFPNWDNYDFDAIYVQAYRTKANTSAPFYLVFQQRLPFNGADGYVEFTDSLRDINLTDLDEVSTALKGQELGIGWDQPARAECCTAAGNSLVLGNIRDYPQLDIRLFSSNTALSMTAPATTITTFRRDATSSATTTDMVNTARYQWVTNAAAKTITGITGSAGVSFTATTSASHSLSAGDWVYIYWPSLNVADTTDRPLTYSGWWMVNAVPTPDTFTVLYTGSIAGAATSFPTSLVVATDERDIPVLLGDDGNQGQFNGNTQLSLNQAARRLSLAINASMRMVDTTVSGMSTFTPWMISRGGNDTAVAGRLIVRQPKIESTSLGMTLGSFTAFSIFVNDVQRAASSSVTSSTTILPSRVLIGYENFPEIFDSPTAILDTESDSAVDVNPSDGQEITGVVPFFGSSSFGAAQQSSVVAVLKQQSIYLLDINEKRAGRNPLQKLQTRGLGCTFPNSIAVTDDGIIFANESGIYRLRKNLSIDYVGEYMQRHWLGRADRSQPDLFQGHHFGIGQQYKLSVPIIGEDVASEVFVYDHTNESEFGGGAWTRYDNHPSTGWCNLERDAYFSSSTGRVFQLRRGGDEFDYQDDNVGINTTIQLRPLDFGLSSARKCVDSIDIKYRTEIPATDVVVGMAIDTEQEYESTTPINITSRGRSQTGIDDAVGRDILTVQHNTQRRRGVQFSVQVQHGTRLEPIEMTGVEFRVAALGGGKGLLHASQT